MADVLGEATGVFLNFPGKLSPEEALRVGIGRHQKGHLDEAAEIYRAVLEASPEHPDALHFLGLCHHQQGHSQEAIRLISRSVELAPQYADAYNNLGNVYRECDRPEEARAAYEKALAIHPSHLAALSNLGLVLRRLGFWEEAIACLERARSLAPDNPHILVNVGNVYRQKKQFKDAIVAFRQAIASNEYEFEAYRLLAFTLYAMDEHDEATTLIKQWLEKDPDNPTAQHLLPAYTGDTPPERASDAYVRQVFDQFATSFDTILGGLEYRAPQLVGERLAKLAGAPAASLSILDAGCGTGLCAPMLRPYAQRLVGVDLSPAMLMQAKAIAQYDDLVEAELTAFVGNHDNAFDAIVSADTLCYFGVLDALFDNAHRALRPGGLLVFTLERAPDDFGERGFILNVHGRYAHAEPAVRAALSRAGFGDIEIANGILRKERLDDVVGMIVSARKNIAWESAGA